MACVTLKRSLDFDPLHSPSRPQKRRRCVPLHNPHCTPEKQTPSAAPSVFKETPLTPEQIANNLRDEIKRLKKRRQFTGPQSPGSPVSHGPPSPVSAPSSPEPMMDMEQAGTSSGKVEKPIFTLKQMTMIAERMCEERVEQVRTEYDNILQQKLSEQVKTLRLKFIDF